jgi:phytoene dehydrogenase-like protein
MASYCVQVVDALMYSMRHYGARFILGETVEKIETVGDLAIVHLSTGQNPLASLY